jgi:hypothetical protein
MTTARMMIIIIIPSIIIAIIFTIVIIIIYAHKHTRGYIYVTCVHISCNEGREGRREGERERERGKTPPDRMRQPR